MYRFVMVDGDGRAYGMLWSETSQVTQPEGCAELIEVENDSDYPAGKIWRNGQFVDPPDVLGVEQKASRVMFRALAQTDVITPTDALDNSEMFPLWADNIGQRAEAGSYWRHNKTLWRVNAGQGHTIQSDWSPDAAPSLFSPAGNPAEEWPEWIQPTGEHNAYGEGAKVTHNGKRWISTANPNTWEPGVYGWEENK